MEENSESLKIVKKRWNWLRKNIGKSIIDFFQTKDLKKEVGSRELSEDEMVEELRAEAGGYGLAWEVDEWAKKEMKKIKRVASPDFFIFVWDSLAGMFSILK